MGNNPSRAAHGGHASGNQPSPSSSVNSSNAAFSPGAGHPHPRRHGSQRKSAHPLHLFPQSQQSAPSHPIHPSSTPSTPIPTGNQGFYPSPARKAAPLESESVPISRSRAISQPGEVGWLPAGYTQTRKGSLPFASPAQVSLSPLLAPQTSIPTASSGPSSVTGVPREDIVASDEVGTVMGGITAAGVVEAIPRLGSATTVGDDEFEADPRKTLPTLIMYTHTGPEDVYVTGSFAGWKNKYPLKRSESNPDLRKVVLPLLPGTHHMKFVIGEDMFTTNEYPTAVDDTGIFVNYIEVVDELPPLDRVSPHEIDSQDPLAVQDQTSPEAARQSDEHHHPPAEDLEQRIAPPVVWTKEIPPYIKELEERAEHYSTKAYDVPVPAPPVLPAMLGKVILNTSSGVQKEDNSVLMMPHHVVLNHLATSSIKNQTLAVSATTRYKKKYVTTILYKSTQSTHHSSVQGK